MENSAQFIGVKAPRHNKTCRTITGLLTPISVGMVLSTLCDYQRVLITPLILLKRQPSGTHSWWDAYRDIINQFRRKNRTYQVWFATRTAAGNITWVKPTRWLKRYGKCQAVGTGRSIAGIYVAHIGAPPPKHKLFITEDDTQPQQQTA